MAKSSIENALTRRRLLQAAGIGVAGVTAGTLLGERAEASIQKVVKANLVRAEGRYETVALTKSAVNLGVVQSEVNAVDADHPRQGIKANLKHMVELIDKAFHYSFSGPPDILFFHEFPITGWDTWSRKEILKFALEIPGEETEVLGRKAKEYNCYIVFGSYAKDVDWPGHVLSLTTIIGPDGSVVDTHWKARNIKGVFPGFELFTTTIYDVLDEYIERYGLDAVVPVTRTPYGNIATSSVQREPELFKAFAMKGTEIMLRTATGGFTELDIQACAMYNGYYTAICNNAVSPNNKNFFPDNNGGAGASAIYGPRGEAIAQANTKFETLVSSRIPIEQYRKQNQLPIVHKELFMPIFEQYQNAYAPNLFSNYQPTDIYDSKRYLQDKSRWK